MVNVCSYRKIITDFSERNITTPIEHTVLLNDKL